MKREALLRELRKEARKKIFTTVKILMQVKGLHYWVIFGDKTTVIKYNSYKIW
ncbi:hypothetical protein [Bartonella sp. AP58NXGY]|uniref:hypothetical protein n=1 Tax=Bartonella sp. AP58NXGY TaxID=3243498 RepID=UPI0035CFE0B2